MTASGSFKPQTHHDDPASRPPPVWRIFVGGCMGSVIGCSLCHPFDVVKIRLQCQGEGLRRAAGQSNLGIIGISRHILKQEGFSGFSYGISSQILRATSYYAIKIALYDVIKQQVFDERSKPISLPKKIAAGLSSGGIAAAVTNPCDLIMVRMLTDRTKPEGMRQNYGNAFGVLLKLSRAEWTVGFIPNVSRATVTTASQLVSYDQLKYLALMYTPMKDNVPLHILASFMAGVITGVASNPMDVIKTRLMQKDAKYAGLLDCIASTARNEGLAGFYKGCATTIARQCTYTMGTFVVMEQIKRVFQALDYW